MRRILPYSLQKPDTLYTRRRSDSIVQCNHHRGCLGNLRHTRPTLLFHCRRDRTLAFRSSKWRSPGWAQIANNLALVRCYSYRSSRSWRCTLCRRRGKSTPHRGRMQGDRASMTNPLCIAHLGGTYGRWLQRLGNYRGSLQGYHSCPDFRISQWYLQRSRAVYAPWMYWR